MASVLVAVGLVTRAAGQTRPAASPPGLAEAAGDSTAVDPRAIIDRLASDDPEARRAAGLTLSNLGGEALPAVERAAAEGAGNPEVAGRLRRALPVLRARAARERRLAPLDAFQRAAFAAAYRRGGGTDPRWDADALDAVERARALRGGDPADRAAALAAFGRAVRAGCRSPLVLTAYRFVLGPDAPSAAGDLTWREFGEAWREVVWAKGHPAVPVTLCARAVRGGQPFPTGTEHALAAAWTALLADPATPPGYADEAAIDLYYASRGRPGTVLLGLKPYEAAYRQTFRPDRAGYRLLQGIRAYDDAWDLRGNGRNEWLPPDRAKAFADRLAVAAAELEAAWKLDPGDPRPATLMVAVQTGLGADAAAVDAWFRRAVAVDPDHLDAYRNKLYYLTPQWHGSAEAMVEFGRECARTENWRAGVPFVLVDAHERLARDAQDRKAYFARPEVWEDVRAAYEGHVVNYPADAARRSEFARYATLAGRWAEAKEQFEALGDRADPTPFGGTQTLDYFRRKAARLGDAPATRPAAMP